MSVREHPQRLFYFREVRGYHLDVPYRSGDPLIQALRDYPCARGGVRVYRLR